MKTECTEQTQHGADVTLYLHLPDAEDGDSPPAFTAPWFSIDVLDLLAKIEAGEGQNTAGAFTVNAQSVLIEAAADSKEAAELAAWLEGVANELRAKYKL